jgi:hypothetical protein
MSGPIAAGRFASAGENTLGYETAVGKTDAAHNENPRRRPAVLRHQIHPS